MSDRLSALESDDSDAQYARWVLERQSSPLTETEIKQRASLLKRMRDATGRLLRRRDIAAKPVEDAGDKPRNPGVWWI